MKKLRPGMRCWVLMMKIVYSQKTVTLISISKKSKQVIQTPTLIKRYKPGPAKQSRNIAPEKILHSFIIAWGLIRMFHFKFELTSIQKSINHQTVCTGIQIWKLNFTNNQNLTAWMNLFENLTIAVISKGLHQLFDREMDYSIPEANKMMNAPIWGINIQADFLS